MPLRWLRQICIETITHSHTRSMFTAQFRNNETVSSQLKYKDLISVQVICICSSFGLDFIFRKCEQKCQMPNSGRLVHIYHWPPQQSDIDRTDRFGFFFLYFQKQFTCPPTLSDHCCYFDDIANSHLLRCVRCRHWQTRRLDDQDFELKSTMLISKSCSFQDLSDSIDPFHDSAIWSFALEANTNKVVAVRRQRKLFGFSLNITTKDNPSFVQMKRDTPGIVLISFSFSLKTFASNSHINVIVECDLEAIAAEKKNKYRNEKRSIECGARPFN